MMRAMFSGVAGLKAHQTGMDVIGNNIANVNTYGFKSSSTIYRDVYYQTIAGSSKANTANSVGGGNPTQIGYGSTAASVNVNTSRSGMATTGNPGDCYINGEGYFVVKDGDDYLYSRVGEMSFDGDGNLVDGNKKLVCGANLEAGVSKTAPEAITVTNAGSYSNITIGSDGTISGELAGSVVKLGTIALANIPNPAGLTQQGGSYYKAVSNVESSTNPITYYAAGSSGTGALVTSALESSNVDLANEFSQMIITERGFQANSKIITVSDEMLESLVNLKR
nr:flagellar hook-basal body complex protein [uncultured Caproiciproducens sp.]